MTSDRRQRVREVFHAALDRAPTERMAFLDGACGGDESLRREVTSLLAEHESARLPGPAPVADDGETWEAPSSRAPAAPERVGPYRVEREVERLKKRLAGRFERPGGP